MTKPINPVQLSRRRHHAAHASLGFLAFITDELLRELPAAIAQDEVEVWASALRGAQQVAVDNISRAIGPESP